MVAAEFEYHAALIFLRYRQAGQCDQTQADDREIQDREHVPSLAHLGLFDTFPMQGNIQALALLLLGDAEPNGHTSELQSPDHLVCRLLLEKKKQHWNKR